MTADDLEIPKEVSHREHQCQGQIQVLEEHDGITLQVTKRCPSRGELRKVGKKLLCKSCREALIEESKSEEERERW